MQTETREAQTPTAKREVKHIWRGLEGIAIGSVAYCGAIRTQPWSGVFFEGKATRDHCIVCLEERRRIRGLA